MVFLNQWTGGNLVNAMATSKSKIACKWSIDGLIGSRKWVYLWTFTTPERCDVREVLARWGAFLRLCAKRGVRMVGVRVVEPHPGGHGSHIHFVSRSWYPVELLRDLSSRVGFGRIHAKAIPSSSAGYVTKYLTKTECFYEDEKAMFRGVRLWSCYGYKYAKKDFRCRVKDVEHDTLCGRLIRRFSRFSDCSRYGDLKIADALARGLPYSLRLTLSGEHFLHVGGSEYGCYYSCNLRVS